MSDGHCLLLPDLVPTPTWTIFHILAQLLVVPALTIQCPPRKCLAMSPELASFFAPSA